MIDLNEIDKKVDEFLENVSPDTLLSYLYEDDDDILKALLGNGSLRDFMPVVNDTMIVKINNPSTTKYDTGAKFEYDKPISDKNNDLAA